MSGAEAVRRAMAESTGLTALVPMSRVVDGPLPQNTVLPAITLQGISLNDLNIPAPGARRHVMERVRVMVYAKTAPSRNAVFREVRRACADRLNVSVPELSAVTIHTDGAGAEAFEATPGLHMRSQDFMVKYMETR